ncbi:unnamed protein product [Rhizophagus irregularis]|nr:unnamed protein product [Rhizophagus irregularis]
MEIVEETRVLKYQKIVIPYGPTGKLVDLSHSDRIQDNRGWRENRISFEKTGRVRENDNKDGTENRIPHLHCKPNMEILTRGEKDSEVYVQCLSLLRESTQKEDDRQYQISNTVESERDEGATMGLTYCPNSGTIKSLQASFGKLCRIGNIGSITQENKLCCLVLPHLNPAQEVGLTSYNQESVSIMSNCGKNDVFPQGCSDSFIVVETFVKEQDRWRMAFTFGYDLPFGSRNPKKLFELTDYIERVAEFGFNYIIVIGEVDYGMVFMDCYGRLFHWEDACQILWLRESDDGLPWFVDDDGNVYKYKS